MLLSVARTCRVHARRVHAHMSARRARVRVRVCVSKLCVCVYVCTGSARVRVRVRVCSAPTGSVVGKFYAAGLSSSGQRFHTQSAAGLPPPLVQYCTTKTSSRRA